MTINQNNKEQQRIIIKNKPNQNKQIKKEERQQYISQLSLLIN